MRWRFELDGRVTARPRVASGDVTPGGAYLSTDANAVYALSAEVRSAVGAVGEAAGEFGGVFAVGALAGAGLVEATRGFRDRGGDAGTAGS